MPPFRKGVQHHAGALRIVVAGIPLLPACFFYSQRLGRGAGALFFARGERKWRGGGFVPAPTFRAFPGLTPSLNTLLHNGANRRFALAIRLWRFPHPSLLWHDERPTPACCKEAPALRG